MSLLNKQTNKENRLKQLKPKTIKHGPKTILENMKPPNIAYCCGKVCKRQWRGGGLNPSVLNYNKNMLYCKILCGAIHLYCLLGLM